jgi:hypothetical protein
LVELADGHTVDLVAKEDAVGAATSGCQGTFDADVAVHAGDTGPISDDEGLPVHATAEESAKLRIGDPEPRSMVESALRVRVRRKEMRLEVFDAPWRRKVLSNGRSK